MSISLSSAVVKTSSSKSNAVWHKRTNVTFLYMETCNTSIHENSDTILSLGPTFFKISCTSNCWLHLAYGVTNTGSASAEHLLSLVYHLHTGGVIAKQETKQKRNETQQKRNETKPKKSSINKKTETNINEMNFF